MPIYDYECKKCQYQEELLVDFEDKDKPRKCELCGAEKGMDRVWLSSPKLGKPAYQSGAVLSDGTTIKGHFGKSAKRNRKKKGK